MSIVAGDRVVVKGAPDAVVPLCGGDRSAAGTALAAMTARGLRVLAVATRPTDGAVPERAEDAEHDLELLGLLGLEDPPRPAARPAIDACRRAGMKVAMVTGDHPATALAIAREVGLYRDGAPVVEGAQLPPDLELGEFLDRDGIVISRVEPEDKLRIARALRARGHVVAMTGDGVNDGPALHEADIGIAMGRSGTDVAREAADLVLLDDDFTTIVAAIEQGRATFGNVRRFLTYHLTDNVAELTPFVVWALSGGRIPLAIGVLQVLALDIGTDTLPAVALGAEPPAPHTLEQPPARGHLLDRNVLRRVFGVLGATEAAVAMAAFFAVYLAAGWRPGQTFAEGPTLLAASGATFAAIVLGQAANAFACRSSTRQPFALRLRTNPLLVIAVAVELGLLGAFVWFPPLARLLDQAPPTGIGWLVAAMAPVALLAMDAADKGFRRRSKKRRTVHAS
jgi:magnesium-transporting ATPase (P-type)